MVNQISCEDNDVNLTIKIYTVLKHYFYPIIASFAVAVSLFSCSAKDNLVESNNWNTARPDQEVLQEMIARRSAEAAGQLVAIPAADICEVSQTNLSKAISLLNESSCIEISEAEAASFVGQKLRQRDGLKLFLVRGECQNWPNGRFTCTFFEGRLSVSYHTMGSKDFPREKHPIVVLLKEKPSKVIVSSHVVE